MLLGRRGTCVDADKCYPYLWQGITKTRTALMTACASGGHRVVRALLEHEARVNDAVERTGYRALHEAAKAGHVMIIQVFSIGH